MLISSRQLPRYDLAIYAPGAAPLYLDDQPSVGGAERQMNMLARALAALGVRVCHIVEYLPGLPASSDGVDLIAQQPRDRLAGRHLSTRALEALSRADAEVYLQRSGGLATGIVALYAGMRGRAFIYSTSSSLDLCGRLPLRTHEALSLRVGLRCADAIVVQTHDQVNTAERRRRVVRIPSLCTPATATGASREHFLWIGRPADYKNPLAFVALAREVPEARFVMVGIPPSSEDPRTPPILAAAHGLRNLEVFPPVPHSQLRPLLERTIGVVNTSDFEGFPNVFLEGWAHGALALSLRVDPDRVISTHHLGAVANGSPEALASSTRESWLHRHEPDPRRSRAVEYVRTHHSPSAIARQWQSLVSGLMTARSGLA